mmetsp:Transcript_18910/g.52080  ORF Transcript_18910/g.52080 Transcript_18910/m.52080 type:complete len:207 (+) Transcript_18910:460-1080(+)
MTARSGPGSARRCRRSAGCPGPAARPRRRPRRPRARARWAGAGSGRGPAAPHCGTGPGAGAGWPRGTGRARRPSAQRERRDLQTPRSHPGRPRGASFRAGRVGACRWRRCNRAARRWCPRRRAAAGPAMPRPCREGRGPGSTAADRCSQSAVHGRARGRVCSAPVRAAPAPPACPPAGGPGPCAMRGRASNGPALAAAGWPSQTAP